MSSRSPLPLWIGALATTLSLNVDPAPSPTISGVVPSSGPTSGGTAVVISGSNFRSGAVVQFGASLATAVQIANATQVLVRDGQIVNYESNDSLEIGR